ncbi:SPbeta phage protein [Anopheles sinensis]|uniref:SPbeta phage protein n=1 Tax=Anopheles sinensis TaxID=74873 RepID=A0A084VKJ3_ANOSI|nr:SPbeta phage protein [Anopheles sinensis]
MFLVRCPSPEEGLPAVRGFPLALFSSRPSSTSQAGKAASDKHRGSRHAACDGAICSLEANSSSPNLDWLILHPHRSVNDDDARWKCGAINRTAKTTSMLGGMMRKEGRKEKNGQTRNPIATALGGLRTSSIETTPRTPSTTTKTKTKVKPIVPWFRSYAGSNK